jgi:hypothetical protein
MDQHLQYDEKNVVGEHLEVAPTLGTEHESQIVSDKALLRKM